MAGTHRSLQRPLRANAAFSALSGAALALMPAWSAQQLGIGAPWLLAGLGGGLLAFATLVLWVSTRPAERRRWVAAIIVADVLWVLGTPVVVVGGAIGTPTGHGVLGLVALVVAALAAFQWRGLRCLDGWSRPAPM